MDAVHNVVDHVFMHLDKWVRCLGIFLDLAKALDTVSNPLLPLKLQVSGFRSQRASTSFRATFRGDANA